MLVGFEDGRIFQQPYKHVLVDIIGICRSAGLSERDLVHGISPLVHSFLQKFIRAQRRLFFATRYALQEISHRFTLLFDNTSKTADLFPISEKTMLHDAKGC